MSRKHPGSQHYSAIPQRQWAKARLKALERDGRRCMDCGKAGMLEVHHVQPLHFGGAALELSNLRSLCKKCHFRQHSAPLSSEMEAWQAFLSSVIE